MRANRTYYSKDCPICGTDYKCRNKDQVYCSAKCYGQTLKVEQRKPQRIYPGACAHCGSEFIGDKDQVFCSKRCGYNARMNRVTAVCLNCKETFDRKGTREERKFCCRKCMAEYRQVRVSGICELCGITIEIPMWDHQTKQHHYCSRKCRGDASKKRVIVHCGVCNKEIERTPSQAAHGKTNYCSVECSTEGRRKVWKDEFLKDLIHKKTYGTAWRLLARYIRQRDNCTCRMCGKHQTKPALHVHHIEPIKNFDKDDYTKMNDPANLITLCMPCHRRIETKPELISLCQSTDLHQLPQHLD